MIPAVRAKQLLGVAENLRAIAATVSQYNQPAEVTLGSISYPLSGLDASDIRENAKQFEAMASKLMSIYH